MSTPSRTCRRSFLVIRSLTNTKQPQLCPVAFYTRSHIYYIMCRRFWVVLNPSCFTGRRARLAAYFFIAFIQPVTGPRYLLTIAPFSSNLYCRYKRGSSSCQNLITSGNPDYLYLVKEGRSGTLSLVERRTYEISC